MSANVGLGPDGGRPRSTPLTAEGGPPRSDPLHPAATEAPAPSRKPRRELFVNTLTASAWSQASLLASVIALPVLSRFLSKPDFGLWTQMISLSALATVADFGMSSVFLRRAGSGDEEMRESVLASASRFYLSGGAVLTAVLLLATLVPGGLAAPFVGHAHAARLSALLVIAAIVANLALQPYTLRLLSRGRLDLEMWFGAGPAIAGTFATALAAIVTGSVLAAAASYMVVELAFDIALVLTARRTYGAARASSPRSAPPRWREMVRESSGILLIAVTPQTMLVVDAAVIGHVRGASAVAIFAVAVRVADLVRRAFSPFTDSLYVTLCRARGRARAAVVREVSALALLITAAGLAVGSALNALGGQVLRLVFGPGYGAAESAMIVLICAATLRTAYMAAARQAQSEAALGRIPHWFLAGLCLHIPIALVLTERWSLVGTAVAVLITVIVFEFAPIARFRAPALAQRARLGAVAIILSGTAVLLFLDWLRGVQTEAAVVLSAVGAVALGSIAVLRLLRYMKSIRLVVVDS